MCITEKRQGIKGTRHRIQMRFAYVTDNQVLYISRLHLIFLCSNLYLASPFPSQIIWSEIKLPLRPFENHILTPELLYLSYLYILLLRNFSIWLKFISSILMLSMRNRATRRERKKNLINFEHFPFKNYIALTVW